MFTCSNFLIKPPEQYRIFAQRWQWRDIRTTVIMSCYCLYCKIWEDFTNFGLPAVYFEKAHDSWGIFINKLIKFVSFHVRVYFRLEWSIQKIIKLLKIISEKMKILRHLKACTILRELFLPKYIYKESALICCTIMWKSIMRLKVITT